MLESSWGDLLRYPDDKTGAFALPTFHRQLAAMIVDDAFGDGESQACAFACFFGGEKRLKDDFLLVRRNSFSGILNLDSPAGLFRGVGISFFKAKADQDFIFRIRRLNPVDDQVGQDLLDLPSIKLRNCGFFRNLSLEIRKSFFSDRTEQIDALLNRVS